MSTFIRQTRQKHKHTHTHKHTIPAGMHYSRDRHYKCDSGIKLVSKQESRVVARKARDVTAVLFGLKFANDIHYTFKSSQASKPRLQSSKHTGTKQNLTQNGDSGSFKVTRFGVSGKAIRH